jgi:hypothetical protein
MTTPITTPKAPKVTFTDANANSFSDKLLRWEMLQTKLAEKLDTMPYAKPLYDELTQLIADAKSHQFELKAAVANARQAVADRKAMMRKGDGIRSRLSSALAFEHGPTSALLAEFGVRPRKAGGRRKTGPPASSALTSALHSGTAPAQAGTHPAAPAAVPAADGEKAGKALA